VAMRAVGGQLVVPFVFVAAVISGGVAVGSERMGAVKMPANGVCVFCCALVSYLCIERLIQQVGHALVGGTGGRGKAAEIAQRKITQNVAISARETVAEAQG